MIRGRSAGVGFVVCALAGVLAGCDGDAASQPTTSAVASPSGVSSGASTPSSAMTTPSTTRPRPRPTVTPAVPAAARRHSAAGAEAFARFYLELVNRAWSEPNPDLLRPYVLPTCKTCANQIAAATELRRRGLKYAGPSVQLGPSVITPDHPGGRTTVQVGFKQLRQGIVDEQGRQVERTRQDQALFDVDLIWRAGSGWRIVTIKGERM